MNETVTEAGRGARKKKSFLSKLYDFFSGYLLAVILLTFLLALTYFGTMAQVKMGLYEASEKYFESFFLVDKIGSVPVLLPGVYLVSALLFLNLSLGAIVRARKSWRRPGMLIAHSGILYILLAGFVAYHYTKEGNMLLYEPGVKIINKTDRSIMIPLPGGDKALQPESLEPEGFDVRLKALQHLPLKELVNSGNVKSIPLGDHQSDEIYSLLNWSIEVTKYNSDDEREFIHVIGPDQLSGSWKEGEARSFKHDDIPFLLKVSGYVKNIMNSKGQLPGLLSQKQIESDEYKKKNIRVVVGEGETKGYGINSVPTNKTMERNLPAAYFDIFTEIGIEYNSEFESNIAGKAILIEFGERIEKNRALYVFGENGFMRSHKDGKLVGESVGYSVDGLEVKFSAREEENVQAADKLEMRMLFASEDPKLGDEITIKDRNTSFAGKILKIDQEPNYSALLIGSSPPIPPRPFTFSVGGEKWSVDLTRHRYTLPFAIELENFQKEDHPGTMRAREYSSDVIKINTGRKVHISMNKPMRDAGYTLYQASWGPEGAGPNDRLYTSLAVSHNPADQWPKYGTYVIAIGMTIHFVQKLFSYLKRNNRSRRREEDSQ